MSDDRGNSEQRIDVAVLSLLRQLGVTEPCDRRLIATGRNNRVSCLKCGSQRFLLKQYFSHPDDRRDRMQSDVAFSRFACNSGIRAVAEPLVTDDDNKLAMFEWITGRQLACGEITDSHIDQTVEFFCELNRYRARASAESLHAAAESCFSIAEHLSCVEQRIQRLRTITPDNIVYKRVIAFIRDELQPAWIQLANDLRKTDVLDVDEKLSNDARCLSPSDFGYHNALLEDTGRLRFFDFEYAGWDDPAKMICDFFCQPDVRVPIRYLDAMTSRVSTAISGSENLRERVRILLPVYRIKWCTILLNEFLPLPAIRRAFSGNSVGMHRMTRQFGRAKWLLKKLHD